MTTGSASSFLFLTHGVGAADYSANHGLCFEANACMSHIAHIEKHDWLETHMDMEVTSGFTKKSDRQLRQADYNHKFTDWSNYLIFGLFWDF